MFIPHDELLVLDWIFSAHGDTVTLQTQEELMRWRDLRERVWRGLLAAKLSNGPALIEIAPSECEELLALVPTTFRWGTGEDVGFNLKSRLALELWGAEVQDRHTKMERMKALFKEDQGAASPGDHPDEKPNSDPAPAYDDSES